MDLIGAHTPARQPLKINICLLLPWRIIRGPDFLLSLLLSATFVHRGSVELVIPFCIVYLIPLYLISLIDFLTRTLFFDQVIFSLIEFWILVCYIYSLCILALDHRTGL